ncbi:MAG: GNAT family N-acetyltransferase [Caulobacteraceae bacterium]
MEIRAALSTDAAAIAVLLRRSIAALCVADHRNDPAILAPWLANKTARTVARWIADPANTLLVAADGAAILSAGCVTSAGEVTLNYVSPDARFSGVSRATMGALEAAARARGHTRCGLESTATAHRFYRALGYVDTGPPKEKHGMATFPMMRRLA